jgi:hypothetical protein
MAIGVSGCWLAWRGKLADPRAMSIAGWILVALGILGWTMRFGDSGTAIAIAVAMLAGLGVLGFSAAEQRYVSSQRRPVTRAGHFNERPRARWVTAAAIVAAGPLAGIAALLIGLSGYRLAGAAGWAEADAIVLAYAAVPITWSAIAAYVATSDRAARKIGILTACAGLPLLHLVVSA